MKFKEARAEAIKALKAGSIQHAVRDEIDEKNLLLTGKVTHAEVVQLLNRCRGDQHRSDPHHQISSITVHIFRPEVSKVRWYIKLYFLEPDVVFISVHK